MSKFQEKKFESITKCLHNTESTHPNSNHPSIQPDSDLYQEILSLVAKTTFMNDLDKMRIDNMTSYVENYHSVVIKFRPKRKYFPKIGFMRRTMLAALAYNENREAEIRGDRRVSVVYQSFYKERGERVTKIKKSSSNENWKQEIVEKRENKRLGLGILSIKMT